MSLTSSPELAASALALNEPECEPSRSARSIPIAGECSPSTGQMSLFTTTCEPLPRTACGRRHDRQQLQRLIISQRRRTNAVSMSSAAGSPARTSPSPERARALRGERSGLWTEYARLIGEVRPRYVIVENVAALLGRGLERVLGDLAALGYDAEWHCIPASAVGAPHRRDRVWIVAYPVELSERRSAGRKKKLAGGHAMTLKDQVMTPTMWPTPGGPVRTIPTDSQGN